MLEINKIYQGDCLEVMKTFPDNSINMILTSPPYDNLRDYKGYTFDFEGIAKELYRVVKDGGVVVWVVGDATIKFCEVYLLSNRQFFLIVLGLICLTR